MSSDQDRGFVAPRRIRISGFSRRVRDVLGSWRRLGAAAVAASLLAACATATPPATNGAGPAAVSSEGEDQQRWLATRFWSAIEQRQRRCADRLYLIPSVSIAKPARAFLQCHADAAVDPALPLPAEWLPALHILAGHYVRDQADSTLLDVLRRRHPAIFAAVVSSCASGQSAIALMFLSDDLARNFGTPRLDRAIFTPKCHNRVEAFEGVTIRTCPELGSLCRRTGFDFVTAISRFHREQALRPWGDR